LLPTSLTQSFDQWPDAIVVCSEGYQIHYLSKVAESQLGWSNNVATQKTLHELFCVDNRELHHEPADCPLQLCHFGGGVKPVSSVWRTSTGDYLPIDYRMFEIELEEGGRFIILSFRSTLDSEYNQHELEKLAEYTNHHPSPVAELDSTGNILFANPAFQESLLNFGFNHQAQAAFLPEDLSQRCQQICSDLRSQTDIEVETGDSVFRWHLHAIEIGPQLSVLAYGFDITDEKISEERLAEERAAARRDFYAKMLHELRTPLNAIVGFSEILAIRSKKLDEKDREQLSAIKSAGLQLNDLITDTLDLSKIEAGMLEADYAPFNLSLIFRDLNVQMRGLAEVKQLEYRFTLDKDREIVSDAQKLRQVLINLISNAIKYTRQGWVQLGIEQVSDPQLGHSIEFRVSDSGIGIPADKIDSLFMSYQQVTDEKNKGIQGTGLGLALVDQLVSLIGGKIWVESEYGEGSHFILRLPLKAHQR
jgi:two-component system autoinducer 2 sensor kinase/phosphatase LuxQ